MNRPQVHRRDQPPGPASVEYTKGGPQLITSLTKARKEPPAACASGFVASRGYKERSLYGAREVVGFENSVIGSCRLSGGCFVFVDEAAQQFVFADGPRGSSGGRGRGFVGRLKRE